MREHTFIGFLSGFLAPVRQGALLVLLVIAVLPVGSALGQGAVSGRVTLVEKPGSKTTDLDNAIVWLDPATPTAVRARPIKVELAMRARQFEPHVRVVPVGSTVIFPNQDPFAHNTFSSTPGTSFDLGSYAKGQSKDWVFSKPGPVSVYCNVHAKMAAFVVVVPTSWYAQASADGRWSVANVPPGKYTLHLWHERATEQTVPVTVSASGLEVPDVQLDARGYVLAVHADKFGKDYSGPGQIKY